MKYFFLILTFSISLNVFAQASGTDEKLREAAQMADSVLESLGMDMPEIVILENSADARAADGVVYIGDQLVASLDTMTLSQVLLHEAGHVFEGHTGMINIVMDQLLAEGLMTPEQHSAILQSDELVADTYAAIGSWMLEPGVEVSSFSQYMAERNEPPSETHPSSQERIEFVENLIDLLTLAELNGAFQEAGFEGLTAAHLDGVDNASGALVSSPDEGSSGDNGNDDGSGDNGPDDHNGDTDNGGDAGGGDAGGGDGGGG